MDFWNIAIPSLVFLAPAFGIVWLGLRKDSPGTRDYQVAAALFGVALLASIVGVVRFEQPVKMELLLPLSTEPSGYFEFSFQLHWVRFLWISFAAALLLGFSLLDGKECGESPRAFKVSFLMGAFLFAALGFLSENTMLSLMFVEIMVFLLYAFCVQAEGEEGELERVSYFKRSCFIFIGLLVMLAFAAADVFVVNSVILMGLVLYTVAFLLSKNTFPAWRYAALTTLQAGSIFFLLGRVMKEDMAPELWILLAGFFGLSSAAFSSLSLLARSNLGSAFWTLFSFVGYLFFLRFFSLHPDAPFWGAYEAVGLASAFALSQLYRFGGVADQPWKKALGFVAAALLLGIVSGAVPGADATTAHAADPMRLVAFSLLTFLLAINVGKGIVVSFVAEKTGKADKKKTLRSAPAYWMALVPALVALLAQAGIVARISDASGESPFRLGFGYLLSNPFLLAASAAIVVGLLVGSLMGRGAGYLAWASSREKKMEDLFPRIDPSIVRWNEWIDRAPARFTTWAGARGRTYSSLGAQQLEGTDRKVFGDRLYRGFREYGTSLSLFLRYLHSGNVRAYLFMGVLLTLFSSLLFLLEGR